MRCHICLRAVLEKKMKTSNSDSAFVSLHDHNSTAWYYFFLYAEMHEDLSSFYNETRKIKQYYDITMNKELTDKLELPEIANDFISKSSRRQQLFGKF